MRKYVLLVTFALAALVSLAPPAQAFEHGTVCKGFAGPDGAGGANIRICIMVNEHDFQWKIQPMMKIENNGTKPHEVHASYLKLVKSGTDVIVSDPFIRSGAAGVNQTITTNIWKEQPRDCCWYSRTRVWVCWPSFAGDPCGSVVVWNSGSVTFP
jgi:hypothetical protein